MTIAHALRVDGNPRSPQYWTPIRIMTISFYYMIIVSMVISILMIIYRLDNISFLGLFLAFLGPGMYVALTAMLIDLFWPDNLCWWKDPVTGYVERWGS